MLIWPAAEAPFCKLRMMWRYVHDETDQLRSCWVAIKYRNFESCDSDGLRIALYRSQVHGVSFSWSIFLPRVFSNNFARPKRAAFVEAQQAEAMEDGGVMKGGDSHESIINAPDVKVV